jgi:hypothetical protein
MNLRRTSIVAAALVVASLGSPAVASAHTQKVRDTDDTRSPLDLKSVTIDHRGGRLVCTIETHGAFTRRDFEHRRGSFRVWFFVDGDRRPEYELMAMASDTDGRIYANLGVARRHGPYPTPVRATRPSAHKIRFSFSTRLIGSPRSFRWQGETENRGRRDFAPEARVEHVLR